MKVSQGPLHELATNEAGQAGSNPMKPETLRKFFDYNPNTGVLTHRPRSADCFSADRFARAWNARFAGKPAGSLGGKGYFQVVVDGRVMQAHRVAWAIATGKDPAEIDHINGDKSDNRLSNLRDVSHQENGRNLKRSRNNSSGVTGVGWNHLFGKWQARITVGGRSKSLGYFNCLASAANARKRAEEIYGFHPNHGADR